jgi:hypothetical protein
VTPRRKPDRILLSLARLEPPLSWLDWFHYQRDRVWIHQYRGYVRDYMQIDSYRVTPEHAAELRHLGFIEPVDMDWNRDRYVLTPAGLWLLMHNRKGRYERDWVKRERDARSKLRQFGVVGEIKPIRTYTSLDIWRARLKAEKAEAEKGLGMDAACDAQAPCPSRPAGTPSEQDP